MASAQELKSDSNSLAHAFRKGKVQGNLRYYFMATDNAAGLSDYHAHAIGARLSYETAPFKGFQVGAGGYMAFNIGSSDLGQPDPLTNQRNRYEIGLFDVADPGNKANLYRIESLYLKYQWKKLKLVFGRQVLNTPFINPQDGRMGPGSAGGFLVEWGSLPKTKIEAGYFYEMAPRSTSKWYSVGKSIGLYPVGVTTSGNPSGYSGQLSTRGIGLLGFSHPLKPGIRLQVHDLIVTDIFNTLLVQADFETALTTNGKLLGAVQYIRQDAIADGGNANTAKAYIDPGAKAQVLGLKLGWKKGNWENSLNYSRISSDGRFLMPREWGREPLFTFLPRERNEGFGKVNAWVVKSSYKIPKTRLQVQAGLGYYDLPAVTDFAHNKYGIPAYTQFNADLRYRFTGSLQGMDIQLLWLHKWKSGSSFGNDKYVINKVDLSHLNLIINYRFGN